MRSGIYRNGRSRSSMRVHPLSQPRTSREAVQHVARATEDVIDGEFCTFADVTYSNDTPDRLTRLEVTSDNFEGLLHLIAWVLKGMDVRVREAELNVNEDGVATDVFKLTNLKGSQLSESRAREVVERVRDFVKFCGTTSERKAVEWRSRNIAVSNQQEDRTIITIIEPETRIGFLLEVVSVLSGIGVEVKSAKVRTVSECTEDPCLAEMLSGEWRSSPEPTRVMEFEATEQGGAQLTERSVQAVLFTVSLITGYGRSENTIVPTLRSYATQYH